MTTLFNFATLFLVAFWSASGVFTANQEGFTQKTLACFGLSAFFLCVFIYNKLKKWYDTKILKLQNVISYLNHLAPIIMTNNKMTMIIYLMDLEHFGKYRKTLSGFFWVKKDNKAHSNIIEKYLNTKNDINFILQNLSHEDRSFIIAHKDLFNKDVLELNALITQEESFKVAGNNGLIKWF